MVAVTFEQLANSKCYNCYKLGRKSKVCKKSATMLTDTTDQDNPRLTDFQSTVLCTDSDEHVFETCKPLSFQTHSFILDIASKRGLITQAGLLKFYPRAKIRSTKKNVIGANLHNFLA